MTTSQKIRYTLHVIDPLDAGDNRLFGVFNDHGAAKDKADEWMRAFARRGVVASITVMAIHPATAADRNAWAMG